VINVCLWVDRSFSKLVVNCVSSIHSKMDRMGSLHGVQIELEHTTAYALLACLKQVSLIVFSFAGEFSTFYATCFHFSKRELPTTPAILQSLTCSLPLSGKKKEKTLASLTRGPNVTPPSSVPKAERAPGFRCPRRLVFSPLPPMAAWR
jgi:hypothetical protein